jgi:hypothetical protein
MTSVLFATRALPYYFKKARFERALELKLHIAKSQTHLQGVKADKLPEYNNYYQNIEEFIEHYRYSSSHTGPVDVKLLDFINETEFNKRFTVKYSNYFVLCRHFMELE